MTGKSVEEREQELLYAAVARLRARVITVVCALVGGTVLLVMTLWLVVRGGPDVGQHLGLLSNFFPGYRVTPFGSLLGFGYGALVGGALGFSVAWIYNRVADWRQPL